MASTLQSFFDKVEVNHFEKHHEMGGQTAFYSYDGSEQWRVVCLGYSLDEIDTSEVLKLKAVRPLVVEVTKRGIIS